MGSIVAEIADKIASAGGGERSELEVRGGTGADGGGILTLSTSELTVVDGDKLGRIDFQAPLETGTDAIVVSASIWAEADDTFAADNNSTELVFAVGASEAAAEKMRLDHDGQLGIGVATPASLLHVAGTVQVGVDDAGHDFTLFGHAAGAQLQWDASADVLIVRGATADHATTSAGRILLQTNQAAVVDNDRIGQIDFQAPAETGSDALLVSASIWAEAEATFNSISNETSIVFATGASELAAEKVRITSDGKVGIGTSAPAAALDVVGTIKTSDALSHRNMFINGAMLVQQRGTENHAAGTERITVKDRWGIYNPSNGAVDSKDSSCGSGMTAGFQRCLWIDVTTADNGLTATDRVDIFYKFEGQDVAHWRKGTATASPVTMSFWVKSPKTGTHIAELYDTDNDRQCSKSYTIASADTWEYHAVTFPADTTGAFTNDENKSLELHLYLLAGSNYTSGTALNTSWASATTNLRAVGQVNCMDSASNNFMLTGVQLELGEQATPFEHKRYGEELARCQRYYEKSPIHGSATFWGMPINTDGTGGYRRAPIYFQTRKRATPTIVTGGGTTATGHQGICDAGFVIFWDNIANNSHVERSAWTADSELT